MEENKTSNMSMLTFLASSNFNIGKTSFNDINHSFITNTFSAYSINVNSIESIFKSSDNTIYIDINLKDNHLKYYLTIAISDTILDDELFKDYNIDPKDYSVYMKKMTECLIYYITETISGRYVNKSIGYIITEKLCIDILYRLLQDTKGVDYNIILNRLTLK